MMEKMMMNKKVPFLYYFGRTILGPIFKWYYNPTIICKENIPILNNTTI